MDAVADIDIMIREILLNIIVIAINIVDMFSMMAFQHHRALLLLHAVILDIDAK